MSADAPLLFAEPPEFTVQFQEAIDFLKQKIALPSKTWRDIEGRAHDRGFVVAGAMKDALLADFKAEIEKAVAGKTTLADFRQSFDEIVAKHGWTGWTGEGTEAGRAWRARVIYETNLRTAYAAGRYKQMTDPDVVKVYKWWRYRHAYYREPERARPEHRDVFNGTILAWDDQWWDTHYPPNGWNCSCGVETMTDRELKAEGLEPSRSPPVTTRTVIDPKTGDKVQVPNGIDFGWDHAPGQSWAKGLVPRELQKPLEPPIGPRLPSAPLPPLKDIARPFRSARLPADTDAKAAAQAFLQQFGATPEKSVLFRDASGHAIPISNDLFTDGQGRFKGGKQGRERDMLRLAEALQDPDEIWIDWQYFNQKFRLVRRYIRSTPDGLGFSSFAWSSDGWEGSTIFQPTERGTKTPDPEYLEKYRNGALLYRRKQ